MRAEKRSFLAGGKTGIATARISRTAKIHRVQYIFLPPSPRPAPTHAALNGEISLTICQKVPPAKQIVRGRYDLLALSAL